ncbi:MAG: hypothetical protein O3A46_13265 [Candidatus Poribacteria bacterium]|nr:hypothetical protein [Candidatus Poribacteria bacterium]
MRRTGWLLATITFVSGCALVMGEPGKLPKNVLGAGVVVEFHIDPATKTATWEGDLPMGDYELRVRVKALPERKPERVVFRGSADAGATKPSSLLIQGSEELAFDLVDNDGLIGTVIVNYELDMLFKGSEGTMRRGRRDLILRSTHGFSLTEATNGTSTIRFRAEGGVDVGDVAVAWARVAE